MNTNDKTTSFHIDKKHERACRADMDMNCNNCLRLTRVKHDKDRFGFLYGKCDSKEKHPYPRNDGLIKFHPDDHMGMICFVNRFTGAPSELNNEVHPWK